MKYGLTLKQKEVFDFIKLYMKKQSVSPSYENIMEATGIKSKSSVNKIVAQLVDRKWITRLTGKHRSIQINP
jgi:repressor LexA